MVVLDCTKENKLVDAFDPVFSRITHLVEHLPCIVESSQLCCILRAEGFGKFAFLDARILFDRLQLIWDMLIAEMLNW